jgi:hypothetical protein
LKEIRPNCEANYSLISKMNQIQVLNLIYLAVI